MAFDAFCYALGKKVLSGETLDESMKGLGAFEIISFELGAENTINIGSMSSGGGAGKATFKEFTITKKTDKSSTELFTALCSGEHFDEIVVALRRSGGSKTLMNDQIFMQFNMKMVLVQDISWSGSDGDDVCEETVIMQYGAIRVEYYPQGTDGKRIVKDKKEAKWNRINNQATDVVRA